MTALDLQSPEQHRQRYDTLRAQAQARAARQADWPCPAIADDQVIDREIIPGGWYWSMIVPRGRTLRVVNTTGSSSVSALFWHAHDTTERFNAADTAKVQWTVRLGGGRLLLSDMGRAMASVTGDSGAGHDLLVGGSTPASNARRYGGGGHRNTRDNFRLAAAKHGLDRRDIPPCLTLFADIRVDASGQLGWHGTGPAGAAIDLRAEMDLIAVLSNCPHPLDPAPVYAPGPVAAIVWQPGPAAAEDPCRTGSPEAMRAFENNARLHRD